MRRQVFFSFHYDNDVWRTAEIRNIGVVDNNKKFSDNDWEQVRTKDDHKIEEWINNEMFMRTCVVVLIGSETADRYWVQYEIKQAWMLGKGVLGIYINKLKDQNGQQSQKGRNPFDYFYIDKTMNYIAHRLKPFDNNEIVMSSICKSYDPPYTSSAAIYRYIKDNIDEMIEEAIKIRNRYPK